MRPEEFAAFVGHKEGDTETIQGLITSIFGTSLDNLRFTEREKLHLIRCAYRRMKYDRDVALSGVRTLQKRLDRMSQQDMFPPTDRRFV
jgi:hypothetical protein